MLLIPRIFAGFVLTASAVVLGAALLSQYWGGLAPCELCILQRWPWAAAIVVALVAMIVGGGSRALPWVALLLAITFGVGALFAFYHVGVEQHWFAGPSACAASGGARTLEEMKRQILGTAPVLCDRVQWSLFGVSLAGWNLLASLVMAAICLVVAVRSHGPSSQRAA